MPEIQSPRIAIGVGSPFSTTGGGAGAAMGITPTLPRRAIFPSWDDASPPVITPPPEDGSFDI